jgi:hypothetical protein
LQLWVGVDPTKARKYFSLSEKYSAFSEFRIDPQGVGLHGMAIPPDEVVRLTEDEVVRHPLFRNFSGVSASHPPMRGWLAASVCGAGRHTYGCCSCPTRAPAVTSTRRMRKTSASSRR